MKIIVIGLGSMGKRRIRLLREHHNVEVFGIDSQERRCAEAQKKFNVQCYNSIDEVCKAENIEAALICTSPLSHASIINKCLNYNLHVFSEINLVSDGYDENIALAKEKEKILFLSSTFLYRKETQTIIKKVHEAKCPLNYVYHVGQYLPDWHPWESYNDYFISDPKTNGCREIMAIDLPWLVTAFGDTKNVQVMKSRNSELNITYNDNYFLLLEHESGNKGVFVVDVIARKPYRHIDIYGELFQLSWNGTADSLNEYDIDKKKDVNILFPDASEHVEGYSAFITENPYREEINAYLNQIADMSQIPAWNFEKDKIVLDVIDKIEAL